eukprot:TRINITY_DN19228_c0_g1_i1.p1 TRINITY_DN19228_c0_g1~~TRINITY_DN19228_c0_g1_i1.p1  ORF type:complete len:171 (+),score=28.08 TRINITY_DN19228_c0_g1_i1:103-615(+)
MASVVLAALQLMLLAIAVGAPKTLASSWSMCDSKTYPVTVKNVSVAPDPVISGSEANFWIPATADREIQGGTVRITVYFHNIPVHTEKDDICSKTTCPIKPGEFALQNSEVLPEITPPGSYKLRLKILDQSKEVLACANVNFEIVENQAKKSGLSSILYRNEMHAFSNDG